MSEILCGDMCIAQLMKHTALGNSLFSSNSLVSSKSQTNFKSNPIVKPGKPREGGNLVRIVLSLLLMRGLLTLMTPILLMLVPLFLYYSAHFRSGGANHIL